MIITNTHVFFFKDWLSNFTPAFFSMITNEHGYQNFKSSEQAFMFFKAETFKDEEICQLILKTDDPGKAKQLGRLVKNYDDKIWSTMRFTCMYSCNFHKYQENNKLRKKLLDSKFENKTFAEASPYDLIWGIALDAKKYPVEYLDNESNWKGENLMGKVLNCVRRDLMKNTSDSILNI